MEHPAQHCHFEPLKGVPVLSLTKGEIPGTTLGLDQELMERGTHSFPPRLSLIRRLLLLQPFEKILRSHIRFNPLENNIFDSILNRLNVVFRIDPQ